VNRLSESLANVCRNHLLNEKWLVAPSLRVGNQWLEAVARSGQAVLNVRVKTLDGLALELADPAIRREEVKLLDDLGAIVFVDRAFHRLRRGEQLKYLNGVESSTGMLRALVGTCNELRQAGVDLDGIPAGQFEVGTKGTDLRLLLEEYRRRLQNQQRIDGAGALRLAIRRLREGTPPAPEMLLLLPADTTARGLMRQLIDAFPADRRLLLEVDEPVMAAAGLGRASDNMDRLRWLLAPSGSPVPPGDGPDKSVQIFRAVGAINEVREVLRRCLEESIPLDQAELLHTDSAAYVPAIYETFVAQQVDRGITPGDDLPVTFAEGIPCRYARPGRALRAWIAWIRAGYPQAQFVAMLREGLIEIPGSRVGHRDMTRLADRFRSVGVGFGRERYLRKIREKLDRLLEEESAAGSTPELQNNEEDVATQSRTRGRSEGIQRDLETLSRVVGPVIEVSPALDAAPIDVIASARRFVEQWAQTVDALDESAKGRLLQEIIRLEEWLALDDEPVSLDVWEWLEHLPDEARVLGMAPRPGCLHVDHLSSGGHSQRKHTFIVGLDDSRFPRSGGQDPLLLDGERGRLSDALVTAPMRLKDEQRAFARLLARLRGSVTLSFSCQDLADGRELFPSSVLLAAFRLVTDQPEADLSGLNAWLMPPAAFAPERPEQCRDLTDWWLRALCRSKAAPDVLALLERHYPHLARGMRAERARAENAFTCYDGHVAEAGAALDPAKTDGPVVSTRQLETLGRCPLAYFFEYGLGITAPEGLELTPGQWLSSLDYGRLLHEVLSRFVRERILARQPIRGRADLPRVEKILDQVVHRYRDIYPPPGENAYLRQVGELRRAIHIFLVEEEHLRAELDNWPAYVEAALGTKADEEERDVDPEEEGDAAPGLIPEKAGTAIDTEEPVPVRLPDGTVLRARGRIDRIDRIGGPDSSTFAIWDYKTGSSTKYDPADPFRGGRRVQHVLYLAIVEERLKQTVSPQATVERFGFFFPSARASGERVQWGRAELSEGAAKLASLCKIARLGAFVPTNKHDDCEYCTFRGICGDVVSQAKASQRKLDEAGSELLQPFRSLRVAPEKESKPRGKGSK
jgi:ATP-dependent helicase/nuclease subunit B